jgi:acyl transferase domain-containing protein
VKGGRVDWGAFDRPYSRRRVVLPTYPFQRSRHWIGDRSAPHTSSHLYALEWRATAKPQGASAASTHWLVVGDPDGIGASLAASGCNVSLAATAEQAVAAMAAAPQASWAVLDLSHLDLLLDPDLRGPVLVAAIADRGDATLRLIRTVIEEGRTKEGRTAARIWLISRGAQGGELLQAPLWGWGAYSPTSIPHAGED